MQLSLIYKAGDFTGAFYSKRNVVAKAATLAMRDVGKLVKIEGRANIAAAGFGKKMQNALRVDSYPSRGGKYSIHAAAEVYHKVWWAGVFEDGANIKGAPLLWIPTQYAPRRASGGRRMTAALFKAQVGKLTQIKSKKGTPLLMARIPVTGAQAGRIRSRAPLKSKSGRFTFTQIKRQQSKFGQSKRGGLRMESVPMFTGLSTHTIKKRLSIKAVCRDAARLLPAYYFSRLKDE